MTFMRTIEWRNGKVVTIDQTKLPSETLYVEMKNVAEVAEGIKRMKMRGAPLLGAAAAFGLALAANNSEAREKEALIEELEKAAENLKATRPTAVNLFWALDRIINQVRKITGTTENLVSFVVEEAQRIADEDVRANRLIGKNGAQLIHDGDAILTHCNAGSLATVDYGTALGVIRAARDQGKRIRVIATETRPKLQGARLTTYELMNEGVPVTLITDNMVGYIMYKQLVQKVIVGADRIVRDAVINKIGTYLIAVSAKEHNIPFYVAAPKSTFDMKSKAADVTIEERRGEEVTHLYSYRTAPKGVNIINPAFDITPLEYVTAIICEDAILGKDEFSDLQPEA
ncbi:MAG: S-methyl-5-thioribose-1-phosphate isomerase [Candidatus Bathyarchaeota archaeon]